MRRAPFRVVGFAALFLLGLGVGAMLFRPPPAPTSNARLEGDGAALHRPVPAPLSPTTIALLQRLTLPVEIRLYTHWKESEGTANLRPFADRVDSLLAEFQAVAGDRLVIRRFKSPSGAGAESAAQSDGITVLQRGGGKSEYFGIAVAGPTQKAVLPRLTPEWEGALEFDLGRAIARANEGGGGKELVMNPPPTDATAAVDLLATMPELVPLTKAERVLKVKAVARQEFEQTAREIQAELQTAKEKLAAARARGSAADIQAAQVELQQLQSAQNDRLGQLSKGYQARLAALDQIN